MIISFDPCIHGYNGSGLDLYTSYPSPSRSESKGSKSTKSLGRQQTPNTPPSHPKTKVVLLSPTLLTSHFSPPTSSLPVSSIFFSIYSSPSLSLTLLYYPIRFLLSTLQSSVSIYPVPEAELQDGTIVSNDPFSLSGHLFKLYADPSSGSPVWESIETSRKPQNHIGLASYHRKISSPKASVSAESTGRYRKKPASTSFPAMTSHTTTMSWTTFSFSE